mgnify:CR=1 FL=1
MYDEKFLLEAALKNDNADGRKDVVIDIETSPHLAYTFQLFDARIAPQQIVEPSRILCFAAKTVGSKRTQFYSEFHHGRDVMIKKLWETIDGANTVITYNGDAFDLKHIRREFLLNGLPPAREPHSMDLLKTMRRKFKLHSNKLDEVGKALNIGQKLQHSGWKLWEGVLRNDEASWKLFKKYNIQDVVLTESAYLELLPWIVSLPHAAYGKEAVCAACGADTLIPNGEKVTRGGKQTSLRCLSCGANNVLTAGGKTRHAA